MRTRESAVNDQLQQKGRRSQMAKELDSVMRLTTNQMDVAVGGTRLQSTTNPGYIVSSPGTVALPDPGRSV